MKGGRHSMKRLKGHEEALARHFSFPGTVVIDVGCGTGELVRWMTAQGAEAIGIDTAEMIAKAEKLRASGEERYLMGTAQELPVEAGEADLATYMASFHHVPEDEMARAIEECARVLKPRGTAIFVEPVGEKGSYYEIVRLTGDERDIQSKAYKVIMAAGRSAFQIVAEEKYYLERSFDDYLHLLDVFVEEAKRAEIAVEARKITERLCREAGVSFERFRYRSICRMNVLRKRA